MDNNNRQTLHTCSRFFLLALALSTASACAGTSSFGLMASGVPGRASFLVRAKAAPAGDAERSAAAVRAVEDALPFLRGVPPGQQIRTLRWMLSVGDDRRLAFLFDDLRDAQEEPLDRRSAIARQRLEALAEGLEKAGYNALETEAEVARIDPDAPAPNYFPPAMIQELEQRRDDPEAALALEEIRRTSPRGTPPPGR